MISSFYNRFFIALLFSFIVNTSFSQGFKVQHDLVVAKDGSGDFKYLQDAIDAVRVYLPNPIVIRIRKGVYKEKISIPSTVTNLTIVGDDSTIISYDDYSGKGKMDTFDSYTFKVMGNDITLENLIIENTAGRVGQAVALHIEGDRCVIKKCKLLGNQDTVFASGENSRQYFVDTYIEGTIDFIFGSATAIFEKCLIHSKANGYITAASTPDWVAYGYVFKNCKLTAEKNVSSVFLGRPWRAYAKTTFLNCEMGSHIESSGWDNWNNKENEWTAIYREYKNTGPGSATSNRVAWSEELFDSEVSNYTNEKIFEEKTTLNYKPFWIKPSFKGITLVRDTSYSNYSAYLNTKKSNPETIKVKDEAILGVQEFTDIEYTKIGDRSLKLDVFAQNKIGTKTKTAILIIHGGGWRTGDRTQHYQLARRLAALGYVCFTPEYRLSTEALYPAGVKDLKMAIKWVKSNATQYQIDTNKVAVCGFSAGGELAAFLGATANNPDFEKLGGHSSRVAAVVDIDGILSFTHPESGEGDDSKHTSAATYWFGYPKNDNLPLWNSGSTLTYVNENTPPTLFLNSSVARMHAGREDYIAILKKHGIYSEVQEFANSPHSFCLFKPWFEPTLSHIDKFLKKAFNSK